MKTNSSNLTLMDEIVLLGLIEKVGHLSFLNDTIAYVISGCILLELAFRKRIRLVDRPNHFMNVQLK